MSVVSGTHGFPSTHWSQVHPTATDDFEVRREAWGCLLQRYWQPLRAHLAAKHRLPEDRLDDLLQSFVLDRVLLKEVFAKADRDRGRFRTFLLNALDNCVLNQLRDERAQKRHPGGGLYSLEDLSENAEPAAAPHPVETIDAAWARGVLADAVRRMEADCVARGKHTLWRVFEGRLLLPVLTGEPPVPYDRLVAECGFAQPAQAHKALHAAGELFHLHLRAVVAEYARNEGEIERELLDWKAIFMQTRSAG
jgi:DNA-directed RNA polymerase specialized sigma24 family protein